MKFKVGQQLKLNDNTIITVLCVSPCVDYQSRYVYFCQFAKTDGTNYFISWDEKTLGEYGKVI